MYIYYNIYAPYLSPIPHPFFENLLQCIYTMTMHQEPRMDMEPRGSLRDSRASLTSETLSSIDRRVRDQEQVGKMLWGVDWPKHYRAYWHQCHFPGFFSRFLPDFNHRVEDSFSLNDVESFHSCWSPKPLVLLCSIGISMLISHFSVRW